MRLRQAPAAAALLAAALAPGAARAHAFDSGADFYQQFLEGTRVVFIYPGIFLPLLALGVLVSLWDREGMIRAWPAFLGGQVAGVLIGPLAGEGIAAVYLAVGLAVAALAALWPEARRALVLALAAAVGAGALATALEGHGFGELSVFIHAGILLAANLATAVVAGLARATFDWTDAAWLRIGWRVVASWLGAVQVMLLALAFVPAG